MPGFFRVNKMLQYWLIHSSFIKNNLVAVFLLIFIFQI